MGREIRRVPADWEHPRDAAGVYCPMHDYDFSDALRKWVREWEKWEKGTHPDREGRDYPYWEWAGGPPRPEYCRPVFEEEPTHYQIYETVSEGIPVSPVFADKEDMYDWLLAEGYSETASRRFIEAGWAPSMAMWPGGTGLNIHALDSLGGEEG